MVLDSRSRVDSPENLNGNDPNSHSIITDGDNYSGYGDTRVASEGDSDHIPISIPLPSAPQQRKIGRKFWQSFGLRAKTTIISVVAITIPLLALGGFAYVYVGQNIANTTKQAKALRAEGMAYRTAYFMRDRYADILVLSQLPIFTNPKIQASVTLADQKAILDSYVQSYLVYDSVAVYRLDGSLIVDSGTETTLSNISQRSYFQTVLANDKPFISQPELSLVTKKISLYVAAPIKDITTGKTTAIIRTRFQASILDDLVKDFGLDGEQYHLIESDGKFFLALEKDQVGRDLKADFPELAPFVGKRERVSVTSIDLLTRNEQFVGYSPLPKLEGLPDLKWDAVIAIDTNIALKPLQQLLLILLSVTGGSAILATVLAIAIAQRATKPVIDATAAVVELGQGNLDTRLEVKGQDELAQLGDNINLMAGQLQTFVALQETQARRSQILAEVSRSRDINELEEPLSRFIAEIRQELNSDRVVVYRFVSGNANNSQGIIVAESGLANLTSAKKAGLNDPCIPQEILEDYTQGRVVATRDVLNAGFSPAHLDLMKRLQIKSNLVVPVLRAGELDSLLIAHACSEKREWQEPEIQLLQSYAEELGRALGGLATLEQQRIVAEQERQRSEAIQQELINLLSDVEGAASGDLTVRAQISSGEIGIVADFFNAIVESLRDIVTQVKQTTLQVNTSVNTNNESIRGLAQEATLQSEQLESALQSVEQMTNSIQQVANTAQQAANASTSAANTAENGSIVIEQSVQSILQLRQTVADAAKKVKRLGEASQQISKIVVLIDQIALKTNMLAVNASIEAALAGEEGRGFAVVAEEVGALAAQSATATKEIESLVESIQQETSEVVQAMEASTVQVVKGTNQVEEARKSLSQIMQVSRQVNELFQEISLATTSQVRTSGSVRSLMSTLSQQSQHSSEVSRNVSIALQETAEVANQLQASVQTFKVE